MPQLNAGKLGRTFSGISMNFKIRPLAESDREWTREFILEHWGDESILVHGSVYYPHKLRGFLAISGRTKMIGLVTYVIVNSECELVTLNSLIEGKGIGTALVQAVQEEAVRSVCSRLWCITTNDNFSALIFYQKYGFRIIRINPGAVERARAIKPSIPLFGLESIPIRDEIELEIKLVSMNNS